MSTKKFLISAVIILFAASFSFAADEDMMAFTKNMRQMDNIADQIEMVASELDSKIRNPNEWYTKQSHETEWAYLVDDMEMMTKHANALKKMDGLKDWQKTLVDKMTSLTAAMTQQVNDATKFLKDVQSIAQFNSDEYKARVAALHTYADRINSLANYGKTRCEFE